MPRHYEIEMAWRNAIMFEPSGRKQLYREICSGTGEGKPLLEPARGKQVDRIACDYVQRYIDAGRRKPHIPVI